MTEYSIVLNENKEIKYTKKFLEAYENNKIKLEKEIQKDINELIKNKNNKIKNSIVNEIINKYENIDIYADINLMNNNLEKSEKNLVLKLLQNNFNNFMKEIKNNNKLKNGINDTIFDIIIKQDKKNNIKAIKEITK